MEKPKYSSGGSSSDRYRERSSSSSDSPKKNRFDPAESSRRHKEERKRLRQKQENERLIQEYGPYIEEMKVYLTNDAERDEKLSKSKTATDSRELEINQSNPYDSKNERRKWDKYDDLTRQMRRCSEKIAGNEASIIFTRPENEDLKDDLISKNLRYCDEYKQTKSAREDPQTYERRR